ARWRWSLAGPRHSHRRRPGNESLAEEPRGIRVVVDTEHQLARRRVQPSASADHLMESDRGAHVLEEDDVAYARHVHPGREQIDRRRDEVVARRTTQIGKILLAARGCRALESVGLEPGSPFCGAPGRVEIVQRYG